MAEDSSWAGWTTPPPAVMDMPDGRRLEGSPHKPGYMGEVRSLPKATEDAIKYAARSWPQGRPEDFDHEGRVWTNRATGTVYRLVHGNPLAGLGLDGDTSVADLFVVEDDTIWFLRRAEQPVSKSVSLGTVGGMRAGR